MLAPEALDCAECHALVHAETLEKHAAEARALEARRAIPEARTAWGAVLALLPPESAQAEWTRHHLAGLSPVTPKPDAGAPRPSWARKLGPLAPLAIMLANGKFLLVLFKLKFLLSLGAFVAFYWALYGAKFGIGFAILILLHEMGHFIAVKRRGLPADMPVFLPGFGAYVRWSALGVSAETRSLVSLAGPLAGCIGAAVCAALWFQTGDKLWIGLASLSAVLNVLNLIPVWVLDGGQAIIALGKADRIALSVAAILLAAVFGQPLFLLVAAGAIYQAFRNEVPAASSPKVTAYFIGILAALGGIIKLLPPLPSAS
jgi:Zn-dependent protease